MSVNSKQKLLIAIFSILFSGTAITAKAGLDSYEIYLNNKQILKQYVNQPLKLESLNLNQSNKDDKLVIYYSQCNVPGKIGKGRTISVRDAQGTIIKQWKFANAEGKSTGMTIAVKELLGLEKKATGELTLFYAAEGREEGQLLAHFHIGNKGTASYKKPSTSTSDIMLWASFPFIKSFCFYL